MSEPVEIATVKPYSSEIDIPFESERHASIVAESLLVDWRHESANFAGGTIKNIQTNGLHMLISFQSDSAKHLRVNINSILDFVHLLIETIDNFDTSAVKSDAEKASVDNGSIPHKSETDNLSLIKS